ncbi:hypothetical protein LY474_32825 [Myxococcus stipitatus]|uniref:hypothetical protein n=1 Tax=Myxococcus stipitatus TaxID=83455 RepID=UPI001F29804E|nr:hypothetical protein [Myxococcus stipitatus]MCE9672604.1 hypothetical protein [Myxococcus stipitatus]
MVSTNRTFNEVMPRRGSCCIPTSRFSVSHAPGAGLSWLRLFRQNTSLALLMVLLTALAPTFAFAAHLKTIDGKWFDFMPSGVYTLLKSGRLQVQVLQAPSGPPGVGSIKAVAIAYGKSLVRFSVQEKKLVVSRGSSDVSSLVVFKSAENPSGWRVFLISDPASYVDVSLASAPSGSFLNVAAEVSPFFRRQGIHGLLGNGNQGPTDDIVDNELLAKKFRVLESGNLFTCDPANCQLVSLTAADKSVSQPVKAPQGYVKVDIAKLPVSPVTANR